MQFCSSSLQDNAALTQHKSCATYSLCSFRKISTEHLNADFKLGDQQQGHWLHTYAGNKQPQLLLWR